MCDSLKRLEDERKLNNNLLKEYKKLLAEEKKKRNGNENGIENLLYEILERSKIRKQSFHGGAMNGVLCRRLLDNLDVIFPSVRALVLTSINMNKP